MSDVTIAANTKVTLHFSLTLEDGAVVDSNFDKNPATFVVGDGSLLDGFEKKLAGMRAGEKGSFTVLPEEGFGQPNPNNLQQFSRSDFSDDAQLQTGLVITFADAAQAELPGVVKAIEGDTVMIDFNHPLAGRTLQFDVEIIHIEPVAVSS